MGRPNAKIWLQRAAGQDLARTVGLRDLGLKDLGLKDFRVKGFKGYWI